LSYFIETCIFSADCRKIIKRNIREYPSSGSRDVPWEQKTGRHIEASCRFTELFESI